MKRLVPSRYGWSELAGDISGGFVAALIALPYGLAMASLVGLPPMLGIFTSILTSPLTALLGRNPVLIGGVSSATVPFLAAAVRSQGIGGAAKVTIVAAVGMLVFSTLRLGRYAQKVPHAVMAGFSCGIGAMMVITQLRTMLGLTFSQDSSSSMLILLLRNLEYLGGLRASTLSIAVLTIAVCTLAARYWPRTPAPLLGILVGVGAGMAFGWHVPVIGKIPQNVPPFAGFQWMPSDVYTVLPSALGLAFVTSVNLLVTSRVVDHFRGRHAPGKMLDADRELGAYGIANLAAGMFGSPMSVGIPARSLANVRCGGSTRMSNIIHALALLLFVGLLGEAIARIPTAALAGVTAWTGLSLMGWGTWTRLPKMRRVDAAAFLVTAAIILVYNPVAAVAAGCSLYGVEKLVQLIPADRRPVAVR